MSKRIALFLGLCFLCMSSAADSAEESRGCFYRTSYDPAWGTLHIMENRFLEVSIAQSAGRITSLIFKPTEHNFLYTEAGDPWGGIVEWVKIGSGGICCSTMYLDFRIYPPDKQKESLSITVEGKLKEKGDDLVLIKRKMRIWKDLPVLEILTECRNEGKKELKDFSYGFHPQLTIGGDNKNDLIFIPGDKEGIDFYETKKRNWKNISSNWFGGIDQKNREGLFFLFPESSIGWVGRYTSPEFYNLESLSKPISLASGAAVNYKFEIVITSGMKKPIFAKNNIVLPTLTTNKKKYLSNEVVEIFISLHPRVIREEDIKIEMAVQKDRDILKRWKGTLSFKHTTSNFRWNTKNRKDGFYEVICSLSSRGKKIGDVSTGFEIHSRLKQEAENLISELENALSSAKEQKKGKEWEQNILWAESFLEEARKFFQRENYEMAKDYAKRGIEKINEER